MSEQRRKNWENVRQDGMFDVVVVGGGINGIGVFRELALQGARILLVERGDFCSGCSAAPSRMIHGGLRYLENGEFGLVRESLRERDALLTNAPHLVHPLPTVIPITSVFSGLMNAAASFLGRGTVPSSRGALPIKIGLSLYDWVTRKRRVLPGHRFHGGEVTRRRWPALLPGLKFSATYHDAWISHPERLGIELLQDTERLAPGSVALNYAELCPEDGAYSITCKRTGARTGISARMIVNATGAWLDETIRQISGNRDRAPLVSGTKGSHLIIDNQELETALSGHMVYFENADGRVCIVFPYLGKVLAGSTDIRVQSAGRVRCDPEEQAYILESLKLVFPGIKIQPEEIVFSYAGIRPLPNSDHDFTGRISRGHSIQRLDGGVPQLCMVGGKWTTFRAFADQVAGAVLAELGQPRKRQTLDMPIGGGRDFPDDGKDLVRELQAEFDVDAERADRMVRTYGTLSTSILAWCRSKGPDRPLLETPHLTRGEVAYLLRHEFVETLSDLVLRRTSLAIDGRVSLGLIEELSGICQEELGLSEREADDQRIELITELEHFHGVSRSMLERRNTNRSNKQCVSARKPG